MSKRGARGGGGKRMSGQGWEFLPAQRAAAASARRLRSDPPGDQKVTVREERRPKGSGVVTVARGFRLNEADIKKLAKGLKAVCGAGGTVAEDAVEVQGQHLEKVAAHLEQAGYQVKRA